VTGEGIPPKRLEARILEWIRERTSDPALREQLEGVRVLEREATGAGYYVTLAPSEGAPATSVRATGRADPSTGPVSTARRSRMIGGLTLLWLAGGRVDCLEIAGYGGDEYPADPDELGEVELSECVYPVPPVYRDRARKLLAQREDPPTFLGLLRRQSARWKVPVTLTVFPRSRRSPGSSARPSCAAVDRGSLAGRPATGSSSDGRRACASWSVPRDL
jgi:hypothetical protein